MTSNAAPEILALMGRVFLGALYVLSGSNSIQTFKPTALRMSKRGLAAAAEFLSASIAFRITFGGMLIAGLYPAVCAFALIAFTLAASVMLLDFWNMEGRERAVAENSWRSNFAVIGGLLLIASRSL